MKEESEEIILNLIKSLDKRSIRHKCGKRGTAVHYTHDCSLDLLGGKKWDGTIQNSDVFLSELRIFK